MKIDEVLKELDPISNSIREALINAYELGRKTERDAIIDRVVDILENEDEPTGYMAVTKVMKLKNKL